MEIAGNEFEGSSTDEAIWISEYVDELVIEDNDLVDFDGGKSDSRESAADIKIMEQPGSLNGESDFDDMQDVAEDLLLAQEGAESVELWDGEIYILGTATEDAGDAATVA